jgi:D-xylose transport system substrate-binding protein
MAPISRAGRPLLAAVAVTSMVLGSAVAPVTAQSEAPAGSAAAGGVPEGCVPGTTKKIAFMLKQQNASRYLNADIPFFTQAAEAAGYQVIVQSAENDAAMQVSQAENVITQGVDAIVIQPVDFNVAGEIALKAADAHIPLASYDDMILGAPHAAFVGRDPKAGGRAAATAVVAAAPTGNYALIGGDPGQTGSTQFQEGYHEILDPLVAAGDITIVTDYFTPGWKTEPAQAEAENTLTKTNNDVAAFLSTYDGMSLGILNAIEAAGIAPGTILVTGQDVELAAAQAIVEGRQFGSVWPAPDEMAKRGAAVAVALANCQPFEFSRTIDNGAGEIPFAETPIYLVDKAGMAEFVCANPWQNPIDDVYANVPDQKPTC